MSRRVLAVTLALCAMSTVAICSSVSAETVLSSGNWGNHTYQVMSFVGHSWDDANLDVNTALGENYHLAAITSQEEHDFVKSLFVDHEPQIGGTFWLGGFQPTNEADPAANWSWVTGETWDYTNWSDPSSSGLTFTQPDDYYGLASEQHLAIWSHDYRWNDESRAGYISGYVAETVPEPATLAMLTIVGLVGAGIALHRKRQVNNHS